MKIIVALLLAGLAGCSTTMPTPYYGKYTIGGGATDYMTALEECRVLAKERADKDSYADSLTSVWWSYVQKYTLACMNERGFELVTEK